MYQNRLRPPVDFLLALNYDSLHVISITMSFIIGDGGHHHPLNFRSDYHPLCWLYTHNANHLSTTELENLPPTVLKISSFLIETNNRRYIDRFGHFYESWFYCRLKSTSWTADCKLLLAILFRSVRFKPHMFPVPPPKSFNC